MIDVLFLVLNQMSIWFLFNGMVTGFPLVIIYTCFILNLLCFIYVSFLIDETFGEINDWIALIEREMGGIWRQCMQVNVITVNP
ncbi:hypothetical protein Xmir_01532 [Xenorhabdus miraniensis]|uniref:Uncharacterized protein n=1 Tax=Xenorhabdus miraniensis TaxID=351674 RepID=A0A2D0JS88_9GAMM|nr:hypothetical protein Xmir_01532 [Xenorhabdus miraniensis]